MQRTRTHVQCRSPFEARRVTLMCDAERTSGMDALEEAMNQLRRRRKKQVRWDQNKQLCPTHTHTHTHTLAAAAESTPVGQRNSGIEGHPPRRRVRLRDLPRVRQVPCGHTAAHKHSLKCMHAHTIARHKQPAYAPSLSCTTVKHVTTMSSMKTMSKMIWIGSKPGNIPRTDESR